MRDSCIFYRSFYEAISELTIEDKGIIYDAIFNYSFNFNEPYLQGIKLTVWRLVKPQLDANIAKYNNGKKAKHKQTTSKRKANSKQSRSKASANVNENDNVNVNENENKNDNDLHTQISHLKLTIGEFKKLLELGYTEYQINKVFDGMRNYSKLNKYKSLFLTAKNWLERDNHKTSKNSQDFKIHVKPEENQW
jgi:hypothetical protein